jgi:hypothetical protein
MEIPDYTFTTIWTKHRHVDPKTHQVDFTYTAQDPVIEVRAPGCATAHVAATFNRSPQP